MNRGRFVLCLQVVYLQQHEPDIFFLAGAFLATFLAGAFLATFLAGAFLAAFFATFLATVVLL
jgi:hypothetical protein